MKYILIGGDPFIGYTGTQTYTDLKVVGKSNSPEEIVKLFHEKYDECGGFVRIFNTEICEFDDLEGYQNTFNAGYQAGRKLASEKPMLKELKQ